NRPWNRADANCDRKATLPMARLPKTPRPRPAPRIDPATPQLRPETPTRGWPGPLSPAAEMPVRLPASERAPFPTEPMRGPPRERAPSPDPAPRLGLPTPAH